MGAITDLTRKIIDSIKWNTGIADENRAVLPNIIRGRPWNEGIPKFGGQSLTPSPAPQTIAEVQGKVTQATPELRPTPQPNSLEENIRNGLLKFSKDTPLATQSAELARGVQKIIDSGSKVDPTLPLTLSLRESGGGRDLRHETRQIGGAYEGVNNPYNFRDTTGKHTFVNYPDYNTAINGGYNPEYGKDSGGLINYLLNSPAISDYRQTGNLNDFNRVFTPQSDGNQSEQVLTDDLNKLKELYFANLLGQP